jgi:hypothetical protein
MLLQMEQATEPVAANVAGYTQRVTANVKPQHPATGVASDLVINNIKRMPMYLVIYANIMYSSCC